MIIVTTNEKTGETKTREVDVTPPPIEESTTTNRRTGETVVRRRGDIMTTPQTQTVYEQYQAGQIGAEDVKTYVDQQLENYGLTPKIMITEAPEGYFYTAEGEGGYKTYNRQIRDFNKQVGAYRKKVLGVLLAREPGEVIEWTVEGGEEAMPFVGPPAPSEAERAMALKRREAGMPSMGLPMGQARPGSITARLQEAAMGPIEAGESFFQRTFEKIREPGVQLRAEALRLEREGSPALGLAAYLGGAGYEFGATVLETVSLLGRPKALGKAIATPGLLIVDEGYRSAMVDSLLKDPFLFVGNVAATAATPWLLGRTAKLLGELPGEPIGAKGLAQFGPEGGYPLKQWIELKTGGAEAILKQADIAVSRVLKPLKATVSKASVTFKQADIVLRSNLPKEGVGGGLAKFGGEFSYPLKQAIQSMKAKPFYTSDLAGNLIFKSDLYVSKVGATLTIADLALARGALKFLRTPGVSPYAVDLAGGIAWKSSQASESVLGGARAAFKFMTTPGVKAYEYSFSGKPTYLKETPKIKEPTFTNRDISGLLKLKADEMAQIEAGKVEAFMKSTFKEPRGPVTAAKSTSAASIIQMAERAAKTGGVDVFPFTVISYPPESKARLIDVDRLLMVQLPKASVTLKQRLTESTALDQILKQTQPQRLKQLQPLKLVPVTEFNIKEVGIPKFDVKITQILTPIADQILKQTQAQKQKQFAPTIMEQVTRQNTATRRLMKKLEPKPTGKKRKGRRVGVYELRVDFTPPKINLDKMIPKVNLKGLKL